MSLRLNCNLLVALFVVTMTTFNSPHAVAHTTLVNSTAAAGGQVDVWPTQITLEFDEELINLGDAKANFVVVSNSAGDQVSESDEVILANTITVNLSPNQVRGLVFVYYRVISSDGHPVEGEYAFTFGESEVISEEVVVPIKTQTFSQLYLITAIFVTSGLFFAIYSHRRRNRG